MVEFEADDALAAGALAPARDPRVDRVVICTPERYLYVPSYRSVLRVFSKEAPTDAAAAIGS
jgi:hypothetical protein